MTVLKALKLKNSFPFWLVVPVLLSVLKMQEAIASGDSNTHGPVVPLYPPC